MAITQITAASLADNAVTSAKIAANQIGSSELDLTANYAFTGTVTGTDKTWVPLSTVSIQSAASSADFNNSIITSAYQTYVLVAHWTKFESDAQTPLIYCSTDNGSSFPTGVMSGRVYSGLGHGPSTGHEYASSSANAIIPGWSLGSSSDDPGAFICWFHNLYHTVTPPAGKYIHCSFSHAHSSGSRYTWWTGGYLPGNTAYNFVRYASSSGNIHGGRFTMYGIKES